jgi:hypothetical protein
VSDLVFTIIPEAVRVRRVLHPDFGDQIVQTIEFDFEGEAGEGEIAYNPTEFGAFLVAALSALGLPEGDLEYLANRIEKDLT